MIRRSPAEVYLQYLVLHPKKYSNGQIKDICLFAQVDVLGDWYLNRLRERLVTPTPFYPFDPHHYASRQFLLVNGLAHIFTPDKTTRRAFQILEKPRVKEFVEAMLISNAPSVAIAHAVTRQFSFPLEPIVVDRFKAFFWNVDLVDSTELRALLAMRFEGMSDNTDAEKKKQHAFLKKAYWSDARKTAAELPFSPLSALIAQVRMGIMPSQVDLSEVLGTARGAVALRMIESIIVNGRDDSKRALDFSIVAEKITNILKEVVSPDEDFREDLRAIALRTDDHNTPTVHALSAGGGSFTTDVGPKESVTNELPVDDSFDGDFPEGPDGAEPGGA